MFKELKVCWGGKHIPGHCPAAWLSLRRHVAGHAAVSMRAPAHRPPAPELSELSRVCRRVFWIPRAEGPCWVLVGCPGAVAHGKVTPSKKTFVL